MLRSTISAQLGPPRSQRQYAPDDLRESRGQGARGYDVILGYDPERLTDATFPSRPNGVTVFGLDVFTTDPDRLVARLKQENGGAYAVVQDTLFAFERLGIVLSDWDDRDSSDRWLAAGSAKGYGIMVGSGGPDRIET
ncbi:hypothetical protein [Methylobacterium sp. NPDC017609]